MKNFKYAIFSLMILVGGGVKSFALNEKYSDLFYDYRSSYSLQSKEVDIDVMPEMNEQALKNYNRYVLERFGTYNNLEKLYDRSETFKALVDNKEIPNFTFYYLMKHNKELFDETKNSHNLYNDAYAIDVNSKYFSKKDNYIYGNISSKTCK